MNLFMSTYADISYISIDTYNRLMILDFGLFVIGIVFLVLGTAAIALNKSDSGRNCKNIGGVSVVAESLIGDRKYQQDYYMFPAGNRNSEELKAGVLAVVCDGMGGMENGEIASRTCAELVYNGFYQLGWMENICQVLTELVSAANKEISSLTSEDGKALNSGTTIVAVAVRDNKAYWVSAGDSRIYLFHDEHLEQLTRDHNFRVTLQERCSAGIITPEQMENDRLKDALISYVGRGEDIIIDTGIVNFNTSEGDILVLSSDGLYKYVSDGDIQRIIQRNTKQPEKLAKILAKYAMTGGTRGKHDNITVLVMSR